MKASQIDNRQEELFQPRLSGQLNQKNELMILSRIIPWDSLESEFSDLHQSVRNVGGQPPKPIRLMIGLLLLQHLHNLSDEQVVRGWVENPYWQHFCGYDFFAMGAPDQSIITDQIPPKAWFRKARKNSFPHNCRGCQVRSGKG